MTTTETVATLAAARRDSAARTGQILSPRMVVHLDGAWGFVPYDVTLDALSAHEAQTILVPGLWEAQAWLELDGPAWYVRDIEVHPGGGCWTLRFGAVMDDAQVYLNGQLVGSHVGGYTPFAFDVTNVLVPGRNELAVRVVDPPAHSVDHLRSAHGKQGWKNDIFPSPPSLYLSYGGIWQSVTLTRHDEITVEDVFINGDPCDGMARIRVRNRGASVAAVIDCVVGGQVTRANVNLEAASDREMRLRVDLAPLATWTPDEPALHWAHVRVLVDEVPRDEHRVRFGVRTVAVAGDQILVNGQPQRIKAALVQGFRPDTLYAEGTRDDIEQEVLAAKALGLNTLRLHIKAFDPVYLDVCDELGRPGNAMTPQRVRSTN